MSKEKGKDITKRKFNHNPIVGHNPAVKRKITSTVAAGKAALFAVENLDSDNYTLSNPQCRDLARYAQHLEARLQLSGLEKTPASKSEKKDELTEEEVGMEAEKLRKNLENDIVKTMKRYPSCGNSIGVFVHEGTCFSPMVLAKLVQFEVAKFGSASFSCDCPDFIRNVLRYDDGRGPEVFCLVCRHDSIGLHGHVFFAWDMETGGFEFVGSYASTKYAWEVEAEVRGGSLAV